MKLMFGLDQDLVVDQSNRKRWAFIRRDSSSKSPAPESPAEPQQMSQQIGARIESVTEKLDNAQRAAEEIRTLIGQIGDLRTPIMDEFRERCEEHAELQAARAAAEVSRERIEELEHANLELNTRATSTETALSDSESRVALYEATLRSNDSEIERLKLERSDFRGRLTELEATHAATAARLVEVEDDAAALKSRSETAEAARHASEALVGKLQQERVLIDQEVAVLQKRLDQVSAANAQLTGRLTSVEEQLTVERKRCVEVESARLAAEAENAKAARSLEGKLELQRTEQASLEAKLEAAVARIAKLDELNALLTQRLGETNLRYKASEDEKAAILVAQERATAIALAREQETETMRRDFMSLEAARAAAVERAEELARLAASRETAGRRAERQIAVLKDRLEATQAENARKRAVLDERLSKMQNQYERERAERAITEGALETARQDRASANGMG
jgi:crescentin